MIKFVKFFTSEGKVQTLFTDEGTFDSGESTHEFSSAEDAVAHSTSEAFVVFDGVPVSAGSVAE